MFKILLQRTILSTALMVGALVFFQCSKDTPVVSTPTITGISPNTGSVGTTVTITGANFSTLLTSNAVMFYSGVSADITQATATALVVSVPSGAQTGAITVVSNGKSVTSTDVFTVTTTASTDPSISSFSPLSGQVGTTVTILGTNFSAIAASNIVTFNGVAAAVTSATSTSLVVTVPADASTGVIAVTVDHHVATSVSNFIVTHSGTRVSSR